MQGSFPIVFELPAEDAKSFSRTRYSWKQFFHQHIPKFQKFFWFQSRVFHCFKWVSLLLNLTDHDPSLNKGCGQGHTSGLGWLAYTFLSTNLTKILRADFSFWGRCWWENSIWENLVCEKLVAPSIESFLWHFVALFNKDTFKDFCHLFIITSKVTSNV